MAPALPLSERARPSRLADLIGNGRARQELKAWADRWVRGVPASRRAALLSGPPGVGKTTAALALAAEMHWSVVEMNASDARNQSAIERVAGRASVSHSLAEPDAGGPSARALILLDEADCLTGRIAEPSRAVSEPVPLREFLRGRYGTVEALNAAWGLAPGGRVKPFVDWSAIPRSPGNFAWGRLAASRRDLEEWRSSGKPVDTSDRGGLGTIARLVRSTHQPIVLTVNDDRPLHRYSPVFRASVQQIRFVPVPPDELTAHLVRIARSEQWSIVPGAFPAIVARSRGDLRAALNDLEAIAAIPAGPAQLEALGARDRTDDFAGLTAEALSSARFYRAAEVRERLDATPDDLLPWIEENLVAFSIDAGHRAAAFERLAIAERLLSRASRQRHYGLWSYASELLTGGVGLAVRDRPSAAAGEAMFPRFLGEMGRSRAMREVRDAVAGKIAHRFHLSRAKVRSGLLAEIEGLAEPPRGRAPLPREEALRRAIVRELELTPDEAAFLLGVPPDDPRVTSLVSPDAQTSVGEPDEDAAGPAVAADPVPRSSPAGETEPTRRKVQRNLGDFGS